MISNQGSYDLPNKSEISENYALMNCKLSIINYKLLTHYLVRLLIVT
ncbi:MAG: hypothetical protein F6K22_36200 [Okeania sp. SIO2F4]|nr:hypothetical protein [Okeania sp. SIO2F4]NES07757.1 hypothetical protein [Okeania sp. SIO2F4]